MTLKEQMLTDFKNVFLNSDEFGETISYTPYGSSLLSIKAIIDRERLQADGPDRGMALRRDCEIWIANDATYGVTSVNKNNDTVSFPVQIGGSNVTWKVIEVLYHDDACWHLRVVR